MRGSSQPLIRIVTGSCRSGTTWVQDVLAESNLLRPVFEPLHPDVFPDAAQFAHCFRDAGDKDQSLKEYLDRYFYGEFHSMWVDYRTRWDLVFALPAGGGGVRSLMRRMRTAASNVYGYRRFRHLQNRIVKFIHANLMLPWLNSVYDARIVHVVRHPAPVVMSQLRSPHIWRPQERLGYFRRDDRLRRALDAGVAEMLDTDLSDAGALTLSWCIENDFAARAGKLPGIHLVHYEDLLTNPGPVWKRMVGALELTQIPAGELVDRPSQQAWGDGFENLEPGRRLALWRDRIDDRVANDIQTVLDSTKLDLYRIDSAMPVSKAS